MWDRVSNNFPQRDRLDLGYPNVERSCKHLQLHPFPLPESPPWFYGLIRRVLVFFFLGLLRMCPVPLDNLCFCPPS